MAKLEFYKDFFGLNTIDEICQHLLKTSLETNYTAQFFVNWEKAIKNRNQYKCELALLQSLHRSSNVKMDFRKLIGRYPEVIKVIPCTLALRDCSLKLIDLLGSVIQYQTIRFDKTKYEADELDHIADFVEASGLLTTLATTESFVDYVLGIEVGLDSNARKNRSGFFLEKMVEGILNEIGIVSDNCLLVKQKQFKTIQKEFGIPVPTEMLESKADFVIIRGKKILNIEANFYSGSGSKPSEIVNSYANRNRLLNNSGGCFVWLTDGPGWHKMHNPLKSGVSQIDYVFNADMLRQGVLNKILLSL
jgi:type II restriction enzyme